MRLDNQELRVIYYVFSFYINTLTIFILVFVFPEVKVLLGTPPTRN